MAVGFKTYGHEDKFWNLGPMPTKHDPCTEKFQKNLHLHELRACSSSRSPPFELLSLELRNSDIRLFSERQNFFRLESTPSPSKIRSFFGRSQWLAYTLQNGHITRSPATRSNKQSGVVEVGTPLFYERLR